MGFGLETENFEQPRIWRLKTGNWQLPRDVSGMIPAAGILLCTHYGT